MTYFDMLAQIAGISAEKLEFMFLQTGTAVPDAKPVMDEGIDRLRAAVSPESIVALFAALPGEAQEALRGHLNPKEHPSDGI